MINKSMNVKNFLLTIYFLLFVSFEYANLDYVIFSIIAIAALIWIFYAFNIKERFLIQLGTMTKYYYER